MRLKKQIEVRWLSLHNSVRRDVKLQHSLMRLYDVKSPFVIAYSRSKTQKAALLKMKPDPHEYEVLGDLVGVLAEDQHTCYLLQKKHVTLGEAQLIMMPLKKKMKVNADGLYEIKCLRVKEVADDGGPSRLEEEVVLKQFKSLDAAVQKYIIMHDAELTVRFPDWPADDVLLSVITDVRLSSFNKYEDKRLCKALESKRKGVVKGKNGGLLYGQVEALNGIR